MRSSTCFTWSSTRACDSGDAIVSDLTQWSAHYGRCYGSIVRGGPARLLDGWELAAPQREPSGSAGTLVSPVTFRPAAVLTKGVATFGRISGGRVKLGI
jgi:hypothetical protein